MKSRMSMAHPDSVEFTMEITLSLGAWKTLKAKLDGGDLAMCYPNYKLREAISELVRTAEKTFKFDTEE